MYYTTTQEFVGWYSLAADYNLLSVIGAITFLKGTVSRDFGPLFFNKTSLPGPLFYTLRCFRINFEFPEIFEFEVDSAVSMTPLSRSFLR
jgi:hypothetical protein